MIRASRKRGWGLFLAVLISALSPPAGAGHVVVGMARSSTCVGCHCVDAFEGDLYSPSLAGQRSDYLIVQLKAFREKTRVDPVMNKVAGDMSDVEIEDLAAYYASLKPLTDRTDKPNKRLVAQGKKRYKACVGCHQSSGEGKGAMPRLAGQQPGYLIRQLTSFQDGRRLHPGAGGAPRLTEKEMRALAEYMAYLK